MRESQTETDRQTHRHTDTTKIVVTAGAREPTIILELFKLFMYRFKMYYPFDQSMTG